MKAQINLYDNSVWSEYVLETKLVLFFFMYM